MADLVCQPVGLRVLSLPQNRVLKLRSDFHTVCLASETSVIVVLSLGRTESQARESIERQGVETGKRADVCKSQKASPLTLVSLLDQILAL